MSEFKSILTEEEKAYARSLLLALEPFRDIRSTMPLQYVYTFLLVATDEGKGGTEYAQKVGVSPTVMTRHLLDLATAIERLKTASVSSRKSVTDMTLGVTTRVSRHKARR
jgi:hypothetical protein